MKFAPLFASVTLAFSAFSASAVTHWGTHDPVEFGFGSAVGSGTALIDQFQFTLTQVSSLTATAVANDGASLKLNDALVDLFMGNVGSGTPIGEFAFGSTASSSTFTSLAAGSYYYSVSGKVGANAKAASYALTSQVSPVPEPESYALMLAGLGAGGFIFLRRRNH
jgi:hypothetical protein